MSRMLWVAGLVLVGILVCAWAAVQRPAMVGQSVAVKTVGGKVPVSVAVRTQSPEVERVIGLMEEKAKAAVGVWSVKSGPRQGEALPWSLTVSAEGPWSLVSQSIPPSPSSGFTLYDDGQSAFILPRDASTQAYIFQYDTIRSGFTVGWGADHQSYTLAFYLLQMNLQPRSFLGALGGLSVVADDKDKSATLVHLRADPKLDELMKSDAAVNQRAGNFPKNVVDLYFDPARCAVTKMVVSGRNETARLTVTEFAKYGSLRDFPSKLTGEPLPPGVKPDTPGPAPEGPWGKAVTTAVQSFVGAKSQSLEALRARASALVLPLPPAAGVRSAQFYKDQLALEDSPLNRAGLTWALLFDGDGKGALEQWQLLSKSLRDPADEKRAERWLLAAAIHGLPEMVKISGQQPAAAAVLTRFVLHLDDAAFLACDGTLERSWEALRDMPQTRRAVMDITPRLLQRIADKSSVYLLEHLIVLANANGAYRALINSYLGAIYDQPIPAGGLAESRQQYALVAALRAGDFERAEGYVRAMKWPADARAEHVRTHETWLKAFEVAKRLRSGDRTAFAALIPLYGRFPQEIEDQADHVYGPLFILGSGGDFLLKLSANPLEIAEFVRRSANIPGAGGYWQAQLLELSRRQGMTCERLRRFVPAGQACGALVNNSGFVGEFWLSAAHAAFSQRKGPDEVVVLAREAVASAADDVERVAAAELMARAFDQAKKPGEAAEAIKWTEALVRGDSAKERLAQLAKSLRAEARNPAIRPAVLERFELPVSEK